MRQLGPELGVAGGAPSGCPGCGGEGRRRPEREQLDLAEPEHERPEKSDGLPVLHDDEIGGHVADLGFKTGSVFSTAEATWPNLLLSL